MKVKDESPKSGYEYECVSICKSLIENQKTKLLLKIVKNILKLQVKKIFYKYRKRLKV